jgi:hypothetical protein
MTDEQTEAVPEKIAISRDQQPVLRFRIEETIPTIELVGQPSGHILKLWMNKAAVLAMAHGLIDVAATMPPTPDGIAILQFGGMKMPRNAEIKVENAADSPTQISPLVGPGGDQIVKVVK